MQSVSAANLNNNILGKISYGIIGTEEACFDIELQMTKAEFEKLNTQKKTKRALIMAIDRSGSMMCGNNIETVRNTGKLFAEKYY